MNNSCLKKSLLAIAVMGTFSLSAFAQSNVTIFGSLDAALVSEAGGTSGSIVKLTSGVAAGSRFGFKGSEDLGAGLSAIYVMEGGISIDDGKSIQGGRLFGRQNYVGLKGDFGTVKFGRQYSAYDPVMTVLDPFSNGMAGRGQNVFSQGYVSRVDNMVVYNTPNINGFSAELVHGFGEVAGDSAKNRHIGASASYSSGPLWISLATQETNAAIATGSSKNTVLATTYDFGLLKGHLGFSINKTDTNNVTILDSKDYLIGATVPLGAGNLMLSYVHRDDTLIANKGASQIGIGYRYNLSKDTYLYTAYGRISNENGAAYTVGNGTEGGSGNKAFNIGMRKIF